MKVTAIVQARMGSSRLPGKVMRKVGDHVLIDLLLTRLARARTVSEIVLATTDQPSDDRLAKHVADLGYKVVRGSENDVLSRFVLAADATDGDILVRITGDCPLVMPELVDTLVQGYQQADLDYLSNVDPPTWPDGLDVEVFSSTALRRAAAETSEQFDREHVTPFLRRGDFRRANVTNAQDLSKLRLTVDAAADLEVMESLINRVEDPVNLDLDALLALTNSEPELFDANSMLNRNEYAMTGRGQKLWMRARQIIPGGNMLLSKRAELFLPAHWPAYFDRT